MLDSIIHNTTGLLHTITAVLAMILGLVVIFNKKGTKTHIRTGYV